MSLKGVLVCGMHSRQCIVAYNGLVLVSIVENLVFENKITTNFFSYIVGISNLDIFYKCVFGTVLVKTVSFMSVCFCVGRRC